MLKRAFLGWLRGEAEHSQMAVVPTLAEEDARHPKGVSRNWGDGGGNGKIGRITGRPEDY